MDASAKNYLSFIQGKCSELLRDMNAITAAADAAAERIVTGGKLYATGDEAGFQSECSSRAGGLMGIKTVDEDLADGDVVLAATTGVSDGSTYRDTLAEYRTKGALVILIGSRECAERGVEDLFIDNHLSKGLSPVFEFSDRPICPTAGVCNVAALWTFVSEYIAACTRRGKMPVCWQSGGIDAGKARNTLLKGRVFHDDGEFDITPVGAGEKGREYLYNLQRCFAAIGNLEIGKFEQAGSLAAEAIGKGSTVWCGVIGHHLHSQKGIEGDPGFFSISAPESKEEAGTFKPGDVYLFNGYFFYPGDQLEKVREAGIPSVWLLGGRETQSVYPQPGETHIDAYWRYGDGALSFPGYDIRVVPPSGVIMTTTLWMLTAQTAAALA
jgi:uncharacterized phosphosugar-binding protein